MSSASGLVPQAVAFEAEVLDAEAGLARLGHHRLAPVVEVLDASDLHARRVDVDPVVGKQVLAVQDQRHDEEVAIAQAIGGGSRTAGGRGRIECAHQRAHAASSR